MTSVFELSGGGPWGFRLVGGQDFRTVLAVSKVTPGGKADRAGLKAGMALSEINGANTSKMTHLEAQNKVKSAGSVLRLTVDNSAPDSRPAAPPTKSYEPTPAPPKAPPAAQTQKSTASYQTNKWQPPSKSAPPPAKVTVPFSQPKAAPAPPPAPSNDDFLPPPPQEFLVPELKQEDSSQEDPICDGCRKVIYGPYLSHQGRNYHPDEFVCAATNCRKPLQNVGFLEENGQRFCKDCYTKHFAHSCSKCHQKIIGEVMHALNQTWHTTCFACNACNQVFKEGVFQMQDDKPYCVEDYNRLFGQTCQGCGCTIQAGDHYLEAISAQWHERCFACAVCHCDLKNAGFFAVSGKPVCANHKNVKIA